MHFLKVSAIFIFMQAIVNFATSVTCPPADKVFPCTCRTVTENFDGKTNVFIVLTCEDPGTTLNQLKNALHSLKDDENVEINMVNLTLGRIPFDFFNGVKIKSMSIRNSDIHSLSGWGSPPLRGLENHLEVLEIIDSIVINNASKELPISHLKNLQSLTLWENEITELSNEWLETAHTSLNGLTIYDNDIEFIGDRAFSFIRNLEYLQLEGNRFGPIARSMFPDPANMLDFLDLTNNALTSLPENIFSNMPKLSGVILDSNGLKYLPENTWRIIWTKKSGVGISLIDNPLICDSHMDWISQTPTCGKVDGECAHPRKKRGEQIPSVHRENCYDDDDDDKPNDDIEELKSCVDYCFEKHRNKTLLL